MSPMKKERHDAPKLSEDNIVTAQGENQAPEARTPNERDQSADSQAAETSSTQRMGQLAHADVVEGQLDTGKSPAMDATYEKQKVGVKK